MLGLIPPVAGRVYLDGVEITGLPERAVLPLRKKVAMVFQGGALFDGLTVGENVGYRLFEAGYEAREVERIIQEKLCSPARLPRQCRRSTTPQAAWGSCSTRQRCMRT